MLVLMTCTLLVAAPIMCVGGIIMALRQDVGLSWLMLVSVPRAGRLRSALIVSRMVPQFRHDAGADRRGQPGAARADHRHPGGPGLRPRAARDRSGSPTANADVTETALRVGRLQALMFPTVMLVLNVSSVAVLWFGGHRIDDGQMQVGALTAFLSYLMQILMSVMMATFMVDAGAAGRGLRRADQRGAGHRVLGACRRPTPVTGLPARGRAGAAATSSFGYPGATEPVLRDITFTRRARPDDRDHRQHRRRQDHAGLA